MKRLLKRIREILRDRRSRRFLTRFISVIAAVVVFVTTYALVLPAITMEEEASCGILAHQHDDSCYEERLVCGMEESEDHVHTEDCYEKYLICGLEAHTHSSACYEPLEETADFEETEITEGLNSAAAVTSDLSSGENLSFEDDSTFDEDMSDADSLSDGESMPVGDSLSVEESAEGDSLSVDAYASVEEGVPVEDSLSLEDDLSFGDASSDIDTMSVEGNTIRDMADTAFTDAAQTDGQDPESPDAGLADDESEDSLESSNDASNEDSQQEEIEEPVQDGGSDAGDELNAGAADWPDPAADGSTPAGGDEAVDTDSEGSNTEDAGADDTDPADTPSGDADAAVADPADTGANADKETENAASTVTGTDTAAGAASSGAAAVIPEDSSIAQTGGINQAENTYTPVLDGIEISRVLNSDTGIYYHHVSADEPVEDSLAVTDWKKTESAVKDSIDEKDSLLGPGDLIRIYLAYTVPAGSLNATNPVARYRLPSNLHLTDRQVEAINQTENGISKSYTDPNTLEITDPEKHTAYLGLEAVEGSRKPSDDREKYLAEHTEPGGIECISATVKVENVFDTDESGRGTGEIIGQDLVITFSPYTIEKNRHGYDAAGQPVKAGETVSGWLALDFNMQQVDWITTDTDTDVRNADRADPSDTADKADAADQSDTEKDGSVTDGMQEAGDHATEKNAAAEKDAEAAGDAAAEKDAEAARDAAAEKDAETAGDAAVEKAGTGDNDTEGQDVEKKTSITTVRKKAKIVFAEKIKEDKKRGIRGADEISTMLQMEEVRVEEIETSGNDESKEDKSQATEKDDEQTSVPMPAVTFDDSISVQGGKLGSDTEAAGPAAEATTIKVHVEADEGTFPEGTTMVLASVTGEDLDSVAEAVENAVTSNDSVSNKTRGFHALDISFHDADGKEIEPLKPIRVSMTSDTIKAAVEDETTAPVVVHVEEEPTVMDTKEESSTDLGKAPKQSMEEETDEKDAEGDAKKETADTLTFDAGSFSIYVIVYTVDFHWEVNGKTFEFSIPGGGFVSFTDLVEVLGILGDTNNEENNSENSSENVENKAEESGINALLTLGDIEISEATKKFVADVEKIEFSNPELVDVSKVDTDTSVGQIKESRSLECQYSTELTEEQIAEINATGVEGGDWVLISLKPFLSEESLTVTMKNGDVFTISVTDSAYSITQVTDLDGATGALVNSVNNNAVQSTHHQQNGRLQAVGVTIDYTAGTISTTNSTDVLTEWTFTSAGNNQYYIHSEAGYLNMNGSNVSVSDDPQAFNVYTSTQYPGQIHIVNANNTYALNNYNNQTINGYYGYNGSIYSYNRGEWLTLYALSNAEYPHVTIHFVDRNGDPVTDVSYNGTNTLVKRKEDGTYTIPFNWNDAEGNVDMKRDFSKAGFTYASTHLAGTREDVPFTHDGFVIDSRLTEENNTLYFFTDKGYPTYEWFTLVDNGNIKFDQLEDYNLGGDFNVPKDGSGGASLDQAGGTTQYIKAGENRDIYVVLDPVPQISSSSSGGEVLDLADPGFKKTLERNGDGTYTLSLTVEGNGKNTVSNPKANVVFVVDTSSSMTGTEGATTGHNRLDDTKEALEAFGDELLKVNTQPGRPTDSIEVTMVAFDGAVTDTIVEGGIPTWTTQYSVLEDAIDNLQTHRGTNWEDAMKEAYRLAAQKMQQQPDEATYVVFFTDGEPSQYTNFNGQNNYNYWYCYFLSRETAKDEARAMVSSGIQFYSVFAFNKKDTYYNGHPEEGDEENGDDLLHNLTKYAYNTDASLEGYRHFYAKDQSDLNDAFANILNSINEYIGITDVKINDSITSLTSVGLTGTGEDTTGFTYTRSGGNYGADGSDWTDAPHATYDANGVHWDLGSMLLEEGVTYKVSFTVWPSQEAYDWVAKLNNGMKDWNDLVTAGLDSHFVKVEDPSTLSGYRYEVMTNPPSRNGDNQIINNEITYTKTHREMVGKLPEGSQINVPEVVTDPLTGTKTTTTYMLNESSYIKVVVTEARTAFGPPDFNMNLLDTSFMVEKLWKVDRPEEIAYFLYNTNTGDPIDENKNIIFTVYQDKDKAEPGTDPKYTEVKLGWKESSRVFDWYGETQQLEFGNQLITVGTIWEEPLDIPFGLMLTPDKADEHGIDLEDPKYIPVYDNADDVGHSDRILYYVLEKGHDFTIEEPNLDYRFDFNTEPYHPMLVNSVPRDVKIEYVPQGDDTYVGILEYITPQGERLSALSGENVLRGQLTLEKIVLNIDETVDNRKIHAFPLNITLHNESGPFYNIPNDPNEQHVPWYGIQTDGVGEVLYYHTFEDGQIVYVNEETACVGGDYTNGLKDGYYGNVMDEHTDDPTTATVTIYVYPKDKWTITNIPGGSLYTVSESSVTGYHFVRAEELDSDPANIVAAPADAQISGKIHYNLTTEVQFTNKRVLTPVDVELVKVDVGDLEEENPEYLGGAVFTLEKYSDSSYRGLDEDWEDEGKRMISDTGRTGTFSFDNLPAGFYKIVEKETPPGYIKTDTDPKFEIRYDNDSATMKVILLETGSDNAISDDPDNKNGTVRIENARIVVGNTPGAALPNSGGPGTNLIYLLGIMLAGLAGVGLVMQRKRRRAA